MVSSIVGFVRLGIEHILSGVDHLLFLLCLIIPFRRVRGLIPVITAFTLGHSITLIGTAYGLAPAGRWFPPFVETLIALSIVYMALGNIVGASLRRRWIIAGLFGLVHGFGFADTLSEQLQFAGSNLLISLLSFNIGIEIGQLAVLCAFVPALALLFRGAMSGRMGIIVPVRAGCAPDRFALRGDTGGRRLAKTPPFTRSGIIPVRPELVTEIRYFGRYCSGWIRDDVLLSVG